MIENRRLTVLLVTAAVLLPLSSPMHAQAPSTPAATPTVNLTHEQRHTVKEFIKDIKVEPITADVPTAVGEKVPQRIALQPLPADLGQRVPQVKSHTFFIKDGRIMLVSPKDNTIADVIE
jgi:hypothetical protein